MQSDLHRFRLLCFTVDNGHQHFTVSTPTRFRTYKNIVDATNFSAKADPGAKPEVSDQLFRVFLYDIKEKLTFRLQTVGNETIKLLLVIFQSLGDARALRLSEVLGKTLLRVLLELVKSRFGHWSDFDHLYLY